jgi:hypothetical protein
VVYGKGGRGTECHGNHDAGSVCIEYRGERLICDPGSLQYPADFFGENRYQYYNAAAHGHNMLLVDDRETRSGADIAAEILDMSFDDALGAVWLADLTAHYDGVTRVRRGVIHLLPGVVAVLDLADALESAAFSVRWHTADAAVPAADGSFATVSNGSRVAAQMMALAGAAPTFAQSCHEYHAPFDKDRLGYPLAQKRESYVEARTTGKQLRLLSLFAAHDAAEPQAWACGEDGSWRVETPTGVAEIACNGEIVQVRSPTGRLGFDLATECVLDR